jgi:hypothetical protein
MKKRILIAAAFAIALFAVPVGKNSGTGVTALATASNNNSALTGVVSTVPVTTEVSGISAAVTTSSDDIAEAADLEDNQSVQVAMTESAVPQADKTVADAAAKEVASNVTVAKYIDIKINIIENGTSTGKTVTSLSSPIKFVISAPSGYDTSVKDFAIIRVHNGETTVLPDLDDDASTITFETDRFSTYAIAVGDKGAFDAYKESDDDDEDTSYDPAVSVSVATISSSEIQSGQTVKVIAAETILKDEDKQAIDAAAKKAGAAGVLRYIDITIEKYSKDGMYEGTVTKLNTPARFTIAAPEDGTKYDFAVVRLHAGQTTLLSDLDSEPSTITFETDRFSSYAIIYAPKGTLTATGTATSSTAVKDSVPKTGDNMFAVIPAAVAVVFASSAVVLGKKKRA